MKIVDKLELGAIVIIAMLVTTAMVVIGSKTYGEPFISSFLSNWYSTFLGVVVGIPFAIWISGIQDRAVEKERKSRILTGLVSELFINHLLIREWMDKGRSPDDADFLGNDINVEVWKAFSEGGELQWLKDPNILCEIANAYFHLQSIKSISNGLQQERFYSQMRHTEVIHDRNINQLNRAVDKFDESIISMDRGRVRIYPH